MDWVSNLYNSYLPISTTDLSSRTNSINYFAPQIFKQIGLTGASAGLFATGVYGIVKIVVTAIGLMAFTEQLGRKVRN